MEKDIQRIREKLKFYYKNQNTIKIHYGNAWIKGKVSKPVFPFIGSYFIFKLKGGEEMKIYLDEVENTNLMPVSNEIEKEIDKEAIEIHQSMKEEDINKSRERKSIPKSIREELWRRHFGDNIAGRCYCCKRQNIIKDNFEVGHYVSVANGGDDTLKNLVPLCFDCNRSMGPQNFNDFIKDFLL